MALIERSWTPDYLELEFWIRGGVVWLVMFIIIAPLMIGLLRARPVWRAIAIICGGTVVLVILAAGFDWLFGYNAVLVVLGMLFGPPALTVIASSLKPIRHDHEALRCRGCGYDLYGTSLDTCPECGESVTSEQRTTYQRTVESNAVNARSLNEMAAGSTDSQYMASTGDVNPS
ncbi:MAG: hypothetical protein GVY24_05885 [Planctomycetes bacterium]|jgi:ribosomal protein L37E|nr:hypothetical protein [Planctomycetota bacterium]